MSNAYMTRSRRERGAVLIHVTIAIVGLLAFAALVIDYGVMWSSRRQAQNAADAAALAGAVSLSYDDPDDFDRARESAVKTGALNAVFGMAPNIDPDADIDFDPCPPGAPGLPDTCVRAKVYRNSTKDPLPTFFATLFGRTAQGVQATATAQLLTGNASDCIRPWAVMDKWQEVVKCTNFNGPNCQGWVANPEPWTPEDTFDKYLLNGQGGLDPAVNPPNVGPDVYTPPSENDPGTGFQAFLADGVTPGPDYGRLLTLKLGSGSDGRISSGWFKALDLPCSDPDCPSDEGGNKYGWTISNCVGTVLGIGDTIPVQTGNIGGQTGQNAYSQPGNQTPMGLTDRDPNAYWDPDTQTIKDSCAPGICEDGLYYTQSPRIVPVPLGNIDTYLQANPSGTGGSVTITNIFGFFLITPDQAEDLGLNTTNGNSNDEIYGAMVTIPGLTQGGAVVDTQSAFLRQVILVR
jgi:Flp pilus assembly protein TadG